MQLRGEMLNSFLAEDLWKFGNATARGQYRVMHVGVAGDEGNPLIDLLRAAARWLRRARYRRRFK